MDEMLPKPGEGFSDKMVEQLVRGHDQRMYDRRTRWLWYRNARSDCFWQKPNMWTDGATPLLQQDEDDDGLTVKVEINQIEPWMEARLAQLFYRRIDTALTAPVWRAKPKAGRPKRSVQDDAPLIASFLNEKLNEEEAKELSTWCYELGLMYGAPGFKVGWNKDAPGEIPEQVWLDVIEPWNLMIDERARPGRHRYVAHIRYEPLEVLRELPGWSDDLLDGIKATHIPDVLEPGEHDTYYRDEGYYRLVEFYDYTAELEGKKGVLKLYLETSSRQQDGGGRLVPISAELFPYADANDVGVCPITWVVLKSTTEYPNQAEPPVASVYAMNSEENLLMSILASAVRREAGRVVAYLKDVVDDEFLDAIRSGKDMILAPVEGMNLDVVKALDFGKLSTTLDRYKAAIEKGKQEVMQVSDLARGQNLKTNTSATEAQLLAGADDTLGNKSKGRMARALASVARLITIVTATAMRETKTKSLAMQKGNNIEEIPLESFEIRWRVAISDAASTPVREAQARSDWLAVEPKLKELIVLAENPDVAEAPAAKAYAEAAVNYMVELWQLPETFRWETLAAAKADAKPEPEPEPAPAPAAPTPAGPAQGGQGPAPEEVLVEKVNQLLLQQGIDPKSLTDEQFVEAAKQLQAQGML